MLNPKGVTSWIGNEASRLKPEDVHLATERLEMHVQNEGEIRISDAPAGDGRSRSLNTDERRSSLHGYGRARNGHSTNPGHGVSGRISRHLG